MNKLLVGMLIILSTSCKTQKEFVNTTTSTSTDTTITENLIPYDTLITIPENTAVIDGVEVNVDSNNVAQLKPVETTVGDVTVTVEVKDGKLKVKNTRKKTEVPIRLFNKEKNTVIHRDSTVTKEKETVKEVAKPRSTVGIVSSVVGFLVTILFILYLINRVRKFFP